MIRRRYSWCCCFNVSIALVITVTTLLATTCYCLVSISHYNNQCAIRDGGTIHAFRANGFGKNERSTALFAKIDYSQQLIIEDPKVLNDNDHITCTRRQSLIKVLKTTTATTTVSITAAIASAVCTSPLPANAQPTTLLSFLQDTSTSHRQLELCLVVILRVLFWAQSTADLLKDISRNNDIEQRRSKYLEARLCAKAMLTGKMGGGSTGKVYALSSLQVPGCLADLEWHATTSNKRYGFENQRQVQQFLDTSRMFYEALASIVEFDGLETLIDPSPRSSLTLMQYNDSKLRYIQRILNELVIPSGETIVKSFGYQPLLIAENYILTYYKSEVYEARPSIPTVPILPENIMENETTDISDDSTYDGSI